MFLIFVCEMQLDRFIPNRSAMDFDYAHYMLSGGKVKKQYNSSCKEAYSKQLAEIFNMNRTRILAFKNKPPHSVSKSPSSIQPSKTRRYIPQVSYSFLGVSKCFIFAFVANSLLVNSLRRGPWMLLTS